jgi:ankyrin repeat protein
VESTWGEVLGIENSTHKDRVQVSKKVKRRRLGKTDRRKVCRSMDNVLQRYELWMARQFREYELKRETAGLFSKTWKKNMEQLQEEMAIKLQRTWRQRVQVFLTNPRSSFLLYWCFLLKSFLPHWHILLKSFLLYWHFLLTSFFLYWYFLLTSFQARKDAMEAQREVSRKKADKRKRGEEFRKRQKEIDSRRDKDASRHHGRMTALRRKQDDDKNAADARNQKLLDKHRAAEVERRMAKHNKILLDRMVKRWRGFALSEKHARKCQVNSLKGTFLRWSGYVMIHGHGSQAAASKLLQRRIRGTLQRKDYKVQLRRRRQVERNAGRFLKNMMGKLLHSTFDEWRESTLKSKRTKRLLARSMGSHCRWYFDLWTKYLQDCRKDKTQAARQLQRRYRGMTQRSGFQERRSRWRAATRIEGWWRARIGKQFASAVFTEKKKKEQLARRFLRGLLYKNVLKCYAAWHRYTVANLKSRRFLGRHFGALKTKCFSAWVTHTHDMQHRRLHDQEHMEQCCVLVQTHYRMLRSRRALMELARKRRAAVVLQSRFRGRKRRAEFAVLMDETWAARVVQMKWRGVKGREAFVQRRTENIFECAFLSNKSDTLKWYFDNGLATPGLVDGTGGTCLHKAAEGCNKKGLKVCLRNELEIDAYNTDGFTPLHVAVSSKFAGRAELAEYLIDHGAWHEAVDYTGLTPLLMSSQLGHEDCVDMLLRRQADISKMDHHGVSCLQHAVAFNHPAVVGVLLRNGGLEEVNMQDMDGCVPLHECATTGRLEMIVELAENGADLNVQDNEGYTPLMYAVFAGHVECVQTLLAMSADPTIADMSGRTALHLAVSDDVNLAGEDGKDNSVMVEIVRSLTECIEVDVNAQDMEGDTAAHNAAFSGYLDCFKLILANAAGTNVPNSDGDHLSHIAAERGHLEIIKVLVEYDADMNAKNFAAKTPVGCARMNGHTDIVLFLKQKYAEEEMAKIQLNATIAEKGVRTKAEWDKAKLRGEKFFELDQWEEYIDSDTQHHFFFDFVKEAYTWTVPDSFSPTAHEVWKREYSDEDQVYVYIHDQTNEVSYVRPLELDPERITKIVRRDALMKKRLKLRVEKRNRTDDPTATEYMKFWGGIDGEAKQLKTEEHAILFLQRNFRRHRAQLQLQQTWREIDAAKLLQTRVRGWIAYRYSEERKVHIANATLLQKHARGMNTRTWYWHIFYRLKILHWKIFLLTEYFALKHPYWRILLYWNTSLLVDSCVLEYIPTGGFFCTGISLLTEYFVHGIYIYIYIPTD